VRGSLNRDELWRAKDAQDNTTALHANYGAVFAGLSQLDQLGHRLLQRLGNLSPMAGMDDLVGMALLRRSVTIFAAARDLLSRSLVEPAKLAVRSQFEVLLAVRFLVHGGVRSIPLELSSDARRRGNRARYYYVAGERAKLYKRRAMLDGRCDSPKIPRAERRRIAAELKVTEQNLRTGYRAQWKAFGELACDKPKKRYHDVRKWYDCESRKHHLRTVRSLAKRFGWLWQYELLYSSWSSFMHAESVTHDVSITDGHMNVFNPYLASAFETLCLWTHGWQVLSLGLLAKAYQPDSLHDVRRVILTIQPSFDSLTPTDFDGFF
jgi:hypothetical protein